MEKRHVSGGLKFVIGEEQRAQALEAAEMWKKRFTEEAKWKQVVDKIQNFALEDPIRVSGQHQPEAITPAGATRAPSRFNTHASLQASHRLRPSRVLPTNSSAAGYFDPPTPRTCQNLSSPVPGDFLTPVANSFAAGGFWDHLGPDAVSTAVRTPITAIPAEPWSPIVPKGMEAKAAYDEVKKDVDYMARKVCAGRLSTHTTLSSGSDYVPHTLVKPQDELLSAELNVQSRRVKISKHADLINLPSKLATYANAETTANRKYSIVTPAELLDINTWLHVDERSLEMTTILDAQRDFFRMQRHRRKSADLKLTDQQLRLAWATKILTDTEYLVNLKGDDESIGSDEDEGYDYSNFLRSIRSDVSLPSDLASIPEIYGVSSLRSSMATNMTGAARSREASLSLRSSTSPKKPPSFLLSRSREPSVSRSEIPISSQRASVSLRGGGALSIAPLRHGDPIEAEIETPLASPEEKGSRRQGPSITALNDWAEQLKRMDERQKEMQQMRETERIAGENAGRHTAFARSKGSLGEREAAEGFSWHNEIAARHGREEEAETESISMEEGTIDVNPTTLSSNHHASTPTIPTLYSLPFRLRRRTNPFSEHIYQHSLTHSTDLPDPAPLSHANPSPSRSARQLLPSTFSFLSSPLSESYYDLNTPTPTPTQMPTQLPLTTTTSLRRSQHVRIRSGTSGGVGSETTEQAGGLDKGKGKAREDVDAWTAEMARIEELEKIRQMGETGGW